MVMTCYTKTLKIFKYLLFLMIFALLSLYSSQAVLAKNFPNNLNGQSIFFEVLGSQSDADPNSGFAYIMAFSEKSYRYQIIGSDEIIKGNYDFLLQDNIGIINLEEIFEDAPTYYRMILVPKGQNDFGIYIYDQFSGPVGKDQRQNAGKFTLINDELMR